MSDKDIVGTLPHSMVKPVVSNEPSIEAAVAYINGIDFSGIIEKLTTPDVLVSRLWKIEECHEAIQYYKNFLLLNKKYLESYPVIPPSMEIDEIWHHHILDTRAYHKDCEKIFGYYFHHYPYFGTRGEQDYLNLTSAFEITQQLHHKEFGDYIYSIIDDLVNTKGSIT